MTTMDADYCIVGGGAAGCVLAARLSEDPSVKVLLIEAGPRDWHPFIHIPATCLFLQHDERFNWLDSTVPQAFLDGRKVKVPQGRVIGGSGSINGMIHIRPQPADLDGWATRGWRYDELLPLMVGSETYAGTGELRGRNGPLPVTDFSVIHPLTRSFVDACTSHGIPFNPDLNGHSRTGVAFLQQNRKGRFRAQTAQSYLRGARKRPNLTIVTGALCRRILFEGRRAVGVVVAVDGAERVFRAGREVILSAGALRSPQILQCSGVGPAALVSALGVQTVADLPAVGENLRDHFLVRVAHRVKGITTINERTRGLSIVGEVLKYAAFGTGMLTMGAGAAVAILPNRPGGTPNVQISFAPGSFAGPGKLEAEPGMTAGAWLSPGESRGTIRAATANTADNPLVDPNFLSDERDRQDIVSCMRLVRSIFAEPALARWSVGETFPGASVESDTELLAFAKERGASGYHFSGTCRMGDDAGSVVDGRLRVRGLEGLRVVDASVMPAPPIGNAHATVVLVAEKGAKMIAEDAAERLAA